MAGWILKPAVRKTERGHPPLTPPTSRLQQFDRRCRNTRHDMGPSSPIGQSTLAPGSKQRGQACERCWKRKQKVRRPPSFISAFLVLHQVVVLAWQPSLSYQCDRVLPACTPCVEASVSCIPRKFAIEPISNAGGNLSHAAIPR